ncbi:hypothetical protein AVEN_103371-1 [Araneus ventricosus]|uniref:Uncharacterized protein n=1 Tax=Araneus ventricosus TaxID=182803 RepID=A0A4Y2KTP7_ARAVE|nr:hypothetical protein AVEN_103371-1 [Araneus ventricosus]
MQLVTITLMFILSYKIKLLIALKYHISLGQNLWHIDVVLKWQLGSATQTPPSGKDLWPLVHLPGVALESERWGQGVPDWGARPSVEGEGYDGNEDRLAKESSKSDRDPLSVKAPIFFLKSISKKKMMEDWQSDWEDEDAGRSTFNILPRVSTQPCY